MIVRLTTGLDEQTKRAWISFWGLCQHAHPRQHPVFAEVESAKGRRPVFAIGEENGTIVAVGLFSIKPALFGNRLSLEASALRGPAFDDTLLGEDFLSQLIPMFRRLWIGSMRISPPWPMPEGEGLHLSMHKHRFFPYYSSSECLGHTGVVDLRRSETDLFASLSQSTRREIRRAERQGVVIRPIDSVEDKDAFLAHLGVMHVERGLSPVAAAEFQATFYAVFRPKELGILLGAFKEGHFLGGLSVLRGPRIAYASRYVVVRDALRELSNLSIGPSLWWEGMRWSMTKGCAWFDLEGYVPDTPPGHPLHEVYKFKERFAPVATSIIEEHVRVCCTIPHFISKAMRILSLGCKRARQCVFKARNGARK